MSRYFWKKNGKEFAIGWDNPMNTFFAQIHNPDAEKDSEYCELWLGGNFNEITDLEDFKNKLPFPLSEALETHLLADQFGVTDAEEFFPLPEFITKKL